MSRNDEPRRFLWNGLRKVLRRFTKRFESSLRLAAGSCYIRRMDKICKLGWKVRTQSLLRFECRVNRQSSCFVYSQIVGKTNLLRLVRAALVNIQIQSGSELYNWQMTEKLQKQKVPLLRALTLELIDTDERREQTLLLLDKFLPHLAADIENDLHDQEAKLFYEIFTEERHPKIRVVLKLKKFEHEVLIHLDSKNAMFMIGSERTGELASNALNASGIVQTMLMRVRTK